MNDNILYKDEAYEIIRETQIEIQSDYVMSSTLDEILNQDHLKTYNNEFISRNIAMKHYYARILFMAESFKSSIITFTNKNAFFITKSESNIQKIHPSFDPTSCEKFAQKLIAIEKKGILNQKLLDIITFSIIPSFYSMFLEKNTFDSFCDLIKLLANDETDLMYQLSRSIFVSPLFLIFLRKVMQNTLQSIYSNNDSSSISVETIKNTLIQSFMEKVCFIPSYVNIFFEKVTNTFNFLKESLFKQLIKNPFLYLVIDFNVLNREKMDSFINDLQLIFDDEFIHEIAQIINENTNSEKSIIVSLKSEIEQAKAQTEIKIIDSIDQLTINMINRALSNEANQNQNFDIFDLLKNTEYKIYQAIFAESNEELNEEEDQPIWLKTEYNILDTKNKWLFMRKLLKYSQPLPKVNIQPHEILEKDSLIKIVREYIISTIDLNNKVDAEISLELISPDLRSFSKVSTFRKKMKELTSKHTEQEEVAQLISKFRKDLKYLQEKIQIAIDMIDERFAIHLFELYNFDRQSINRTIDIVQNPIENLSKFNKYIETESKKAISLFGVPEAKLNIEKDKIVSTYRKILCGKFYQNFDFYSYLAMRPELRKFDDMFHDACLSHIKICFMSADTSKYINKVKNAVKNMSVFNDVLSAFSNAFEMNGDPVLKYSSINQSFNAIFDDMKSYSGIDGADYTLPLSIYFISVTNPPYFISNLVFLYEYVECFVDEEIQSNVFGNLLMAFNYIVSYFPILNKKYPLFRLVRTKNRNIELLITGNDPLFIASIYKKISLVINDDEPNFNGKDVSEIAEKIDKSKIVQIVESSSKLDGDDIQKYISFYIRMGVDIPLSKPDNKYAARMAIYALNKPIKIFKPNNYKNFVNTKYVARKMIIVPNDFESFSESNISVFKENDFIHQLFKILKRDIQ